VGRRITGKFLTLQELESGGCTDKSTGGTVEIDPESKSEIEQNPDYAIAVNVADNVLTVAMTPKKPGG
jgi:hypothetical protein